MGGNVFQNTSGIKKEYIKPTLDKFIRELCRIFPNNSNYISNYILLGSAGKKDVSGDIDLAMSNDIIYGGDRWGISPDVINDIYNKFKKRSRTATHEQLLKRSFIVSIANKIEQESCMILTDVKGSSGGALFCIFPQFDEDGEDTGMKVQIDINFGDLDWLKFAYHSDVYENNIKGLHRTQLILALFTNKGYIFSHNYGVKNKYTQEIVATSPLQAIRLLNNLYNFELNEYILENYFKLHDFLKIKLNNDELFDIYSIYLKVLDSTRCDIPIDLQQYWIDNRDKLGLTGKFIPQNSNIFSFNIIKK